MDFVGVQMGVGGDCYCCCCCCTLLLLLLPTWIVVVVQCPLLHCCCCWRKWPLRYSCWYCCWWYSSVDIANSDIVRKHSIAVNYCDCVVNIVVLSPLFITLLLYCYYFIVIIVVYCCCCCYCVLLLLLSYCYCCCYCYCCSWLLLLFVIDLIVGCYWIRFRCDSRYLLHC